MSKYRTLAKIKLECFIGAGLWFLTSPLTVLILGIVKLTSPGPGMYRQERIGLNGTTFEIVKLRTWVEINENNESRRLPRSCRESYRVTQVGRILRTTHLDDLPQLWNVARGEMSLFGPSPQRPKGFLPRTTEIGGRNNRVTVRPGVFNLQQEFLAPLADLLLELWMSIEVTLQTIWLRLRILLEERESSTKIMDARLHSQNEMLCLWGLSMLDLFHRRLRFFLPRKTREQVFDPVLYEEQIDFLEDISSESGRLHGYLACVRLLFRLFFRLVDVLLGAVWSRLCAVVSGWIAWLVS